LRINSAGDRFWRCQRLAANAAQRQPLLLRSVHPRLALLLECDRPFPPSVWLAAKPTPTEGRTNTGDPLIPPMDRALMRYTSANPRSVCIGSDGIIAKEPCRPMGITRSLSPRLRGGRNYHPSGGFSLYPQSHPFTAERIFGLPETAAFSASSVSIRSRTFLVISSSISGALRISTG